MPAYDSVLALGDNFMRCKWSISDATPLVLRDEVPAEIFSQLVSSKLATVRGSLPTPSDSTPSRDVLIREHMPKTDSKRTCGNGEGACGSPLFPD